MAIGAWKVGYWRFKCLQGVYLIISGFGKPEKRVHKNIADSSYMYTCMYLIIIF